MTSTQLPSPLVIPDNLEGKEDTVDLPYADSVMDLDDEADRTLEDELIAMSENNFEQEPSRENVRQFFNQPVNKAWRDEAIKILMENKLGIKRKVGKKLFLKKAPASLIIPKNVKLSHVTVEKLMIAAKKHNILIDASENNITMPIGGELYIFDCQYLTLDWKEHILCDGHHWKIKYAIHPVQCNFDKREYYALNAEKVPTPDFLRYAYYNTDSKVLLVHYVGSD